MLKLLSLWLVKPLRDLNFTEYSYVCMHYDLPGGAHKMVMIYSVLYLIPDKTCIYVGSSWT